MRARLRTTTKDGKISGTHREDGGLGGPQGAGAWKGTPPAGPQCRAGVRKAGRRVWGRVANTLTPLSSAL